MKRIDVFKPIIKNLCKEYDISIRWNDNGVQGKNGIHWWADPDDRTILIPNPKTSYRFLICLHEIGHVVRGLNSASYYMNEYVAEEWAIKKAAEYNVKNLKYEKQAAYQLVGYINYDIETGNTSEKRVSKKVKKWIKKRKVSL